jgi:hypothetical protein
LGRDNHPRQRQAKQLERKKPKRPAYDRILVVTEGEKTEVNYLEEIRRFYRLSSAHIRVCHSPYGTTPLQVVEYARDRCLETSEWESVFCVIDRDDHQSYVNALHAAQALDGKHRNDLGKPMPSPRYRLIRASNCGCCFISKPTMVIFTGTTLFACSVTGTYTAMKKVVAERLRRLCRIWSRHTPMRHGFGRGKKAEG